MIDDIASSFRFPAVHHKKVTAAFDGGRLASDGGVLLLAQAERAMGICRRLAGCIADRRDPGRVVHRLDDMLRARVTERHWAQVGAGAPLRKRLLWQAIVLAKLR
jgi:hypothetical protein